MILESYNMLQLIRQRPAMWIGEASLKSINIYINGYYHALQDNNIVQRNASNDPFFDWVANKLGFNESTAGWVNMILAHSMGFNPKHINWDEFLERPVSQEQHSKSIIMFYELIEEYKDVVGCK